MFAFIFGSSNPRRVAERQLNRAKLDLLEVAGALETYEAQKKALETRVTRLEGVVTTERAREQRENAVHKTTKERARSAGNGLLQDA